MKTFAIAAAAALLSTAFIADANAWERRGTAYGPYGGKATVDRHCSGGACETTRTYTAPDGRTWTREQHVTTDGQGGWHREGKATGPNGGTATFGGTGKCSGGVCEYSGGRSGPAGESRWQGSFRRY